MKSNPYNSLLNKNAKQKMIFVYNFLLFLCLFSCNQKIENYLKQKQSNTNTISVYIKPVTVEMEISFLSSISSRKVQEGKVEEEISYRSDYFARWFYLQLSNLLEKNHFRVTSKDKADLIIKTSIVDMSEIRPKMFIEGLSIGLVFGLIAGELSGDPQVGLGVFLLEVVEEFVILYILKSYFLVTTIETEFISAKGDLLKSTEFTAYSNKEYISKLPKQKQDIRENKVRASLDQNAKDIVEYLKDYTNQNN